MEANNLNNLGGLSLLPGECSNCRLARAGVGRCPQHTDQVPAEFGGAAYRGVEIGSIAVDESQSSPIQLPSLPSHVSRAKPNAPHLSKEVRRALGLGSTGSIARSRGLDRAAANAGIMQIQKTQQEMTALAGWLSRYFKAASPAVRKIAVVMAGLEKIKMEIQLAVEGNRKEERKRQELVKEEINRREIAEGVEGWENGERK